MIFPTKEEVLAKKEQEEAARLKGEYVRVSSFINKTLREKASATIYISPPDWNTPLFQAMKKELQDQGWGTSYSSSTECLYIA